MEDRLFLKVSINEDSGFCFGVITAIKKAEELLDKGIEVYCVGQIVHNDEEVNRLEKKGLKTINHEELELLHNKTILFRAHGEPTSSYVVSRKNNNEVIDATCSIVSRLQQRIKSDYLKGKNIFIYGRLNHPEVIGLVAQTDGNAYVFEKKEDLDFVEIPDSIALYSQTTKSLLKFREVSDYLKNKGVNVDFNDTVCRQVCIRETKLATFAKNFDKIIFIAGRNSSNGKVLFNICKQNNEKSIFISSINELKKEMFSFNEKIGISGATSTPKWQMEEVKNLLEKW